MLGGVDCGTEEGPAIGGGDDVLLAELSSLANRMCLLDLVFSASAAAFRPRRVNGRLAAPIS